MKTPYTDHIAALVGPGLDPRHVEAYMRIEHGTLDHLSPHAFEAEARVATECIALGGKAEAEALAASYGL